MKVVLDDKSKNAIAEKLQNSKKNAVRIISALSCWAPAFTLALDELRDNDISTEAEGITFVTHESNAKIIVNVEIMYETNPNVEGFGSNFIVNVSK